jgi:O-antigen ligase
MIFMIVVWLFQPKVWVMNRLHAVFGLFIIAMLVCWQASPYPRLGDQTVEDYLKVVVFYVIFVTSVRDARSLRRLVLMVLISFSLYMGHSMIEYLRGRHVYRMATPRMIGVDATYNDPNTFSASLLYALPLSFAFWSEATSWRPRLLLAGYTLQTIVCILLTGSRGGLIGLVILVLLRVATARRRFLWLILLAFAAPPAFLALPEALQNRFETIIDPSVGPANAKQSGDGRLKGFEDGLRLFERSPITGVGPNAFGRAVGHGNQAHNLIGQTLGEMGILGGTVLALMVTCFLLNGLEMRRIYRLSGAPPDFLRHLSAAVSTTVLLLLIMGVGGHNLYRYTWLWYGAFQAVALHLARPRATEAAWEGAYDEPRDVEVAAV